MRLPTAKYEVYMKKWLYLLGVSIGNHPKRWITVLLAVTAVSCLGFTRFHQINNARVTFTAHDSPSHKEGAMFDAFLRQNGTLHMIEVLISSADGGNLLRKDHLNQLNEMTKWMRDRIQVEVPEDGLLRGYKDMCSPYCEKNEPFFAVLDLFQANSSNFEVTYPKTDIFGHQILIANSIYGVQTVPGTSKISSFTTALLRFYLTNPTLKPMLEFEDQLIKLCYQSDKWPLLMGQVGSDNMVAKEVRRLGTSTAPYLALSLLLLCVFLIVCSLRHRRSESKPLEACLGALIPVLAGLTTVGMVSATGLVFQSIVVSTLFLILAIGIDDVFIILSAWHRANKAYGTAHRVGITVQEAGCSMTVTTVTNLISFGNGVFSTTPVLQTFAIYSSVASVICFIYQLVIFPAILAITAENEEKTEKTWQFIDKMSKWAELKWKTLASTIGKNWPRLLTISVLFGYWYLAGSGISVMKTDLSIQKMADKNSKIVRFKEAVDRILPEMQSVAVLIDNPPDLRNSENLEELKMMIGEFENSMNSFGSESTVCWLSAYLEWIAFFREIEDSEDVTSSGTSSEVPRAIQKPSTSSGAIEKKSKDLKVIGNFQKSLTSSEVTTSSGDAREDSEATEDTQKASTSTSSEAIQKPSKSSGASEKKSEDLEANGDFQKSLTSSEAPRSSEATPTSSGRDSEDLRIPEDFQKPSTSSGKDSEGSEAPGAQKSRLRKSLTSSEVPTSSGKDSESPTSSEFTYTELPAFLASEPQFSPMLRLNTSLCLQNHPECVKKFVFTTGFVDVVKYQEMYPIVENWRQIARNHPKMAIYPYTERSNFVDQTVEMVENIWITVASEVICMAASFIIFIPDTVSILSAVFSLLSVNFGVFGFLSIWNVGMDPISLASLLMSIGFSVDISAHISYHYYQVDKPTPREKLIHVYTHIGWPTIQGGLSTMLAMVPIMLCPSYLGMVFLKTVVLVSTFGLLHGLIVLPVFLTIFSEISEKLNGFRRRREPKINELQSNLPQQISIGDFENAGKP